MWMFFLSLDFSRSEIKGWILSNNICDKETTAICAYCSNDSAIDESSGFPMTKEFLGAMNEQRFKICDNSIKSRKIFLLIEIIYKIMHIS